MRRLQTRCSACQVEVELDPSQVWVSLDEADGYRYGFVCPDCGLSVSRPASDASVLLLTKAGVAVRERPLTPIEEVVVETFGRCIRALPDGELMARLSGGVA